MIRKLSFALMISVCLLAFLLPTTCFAAEVESPTVTINGYVLDTETPYFKNEGEGGTYGTASDYNAYFDVQAGTLTLKNLDIQTWRQSGIVSTGKLDLILEGDSYIKITCSVNDNKVYFYGIDADDLTIRGSGSLTIPYVSGRYGRQNTTGITAGNLTIESGTVDVSYAYDDGLAATNLKITGGTIAATGGRYGIFAHNMDISGGKVTAFGLKAGIYATTSLNISRGNVSVTPPNTSNPDKGISAPVFTMTGGSVSVTADDYGIYCSSGLHLSGGSLTVHADGTATYYERTGIYSGKSGVVYLTGGNLEIYSAEGAFTVTPTISSCCTYQLKQGESKTAANNTVINNLVPSSLYIYMNCTATAHKIEEIPAVSPTCTENGRTACARCSKCELYTVAPITVYKIAHSYVEENTESTFLRYAATCKRAAVYYHSCVCGAIANGTYNLSTFTYGDPLPHTEVTDDAVAPTCGNTGLTEGKHCSVCKTVTVAQEEVPATGEHEYRLLEAVVPTCVKTGLTAGSDCPTCGYVHAAQEEIPATGEHGYQMDKAVDPTCTETGLTLGASCPTCDLIHVPQEIVPATGHTTEIDTAVEPTCTETGLTEGSHCSVCGEVFVAQEELPLAAHTEVIDPEVEPTCTKTGLTEGSHCSVCGEVLKEQETIAKKTHSVVFDYPKDATCTEAGATGNGMHCSVCGEVLIAQEIIPALGHSDTVDYAVAPTCTTTGLTEGKHCSVCSEVLVAQEEVPALGHLYSAASFTWTEDLASATAIRTCHCGHEETAVCTLNWDISTPNKMTVTASVVFDEETFIDSKSITATTDGSRITITLPHAISGLQIIAATYDDGRMIDCVIAEVMGNTIILDIVGSSIRLFFLDGDYYPMFLSMSF